MQEEYKRAVTSEFYVVNQRLKASFSLMKNDLRAMDEKIRKLQDDLREEVVKRDCFRKDADDFTQKVVSLRLLLSEMKAIKNNVVLTRDLAKIEGSIKASFRKDIDDYRKEVKDLESKLGEYKRMVKDLEKGAVKKEKRRWFFRKRD